MYFVITSLDKVLIDNRLFYSFLPLVLKYYFICLGYVRVVPSSLRKTVGENANFLCRSYREKKWTFNNGKIPSNVVLTGKNKSILIISNIQLNNRGTYECTTTDEKNKEHSEFGALSVNCKLYSIT